MSNPGQSSDLEKGVFYFPLWDLTLREQMSSYRYLYWMFRDEKFIDNQISNLPLPPAFPSQHQATRYLYEKRISNSFTTYTKQMIVVAVTFLESIVENFLDCIFFWQPDKKDQYSKRYSNKRKPLKEKLDLLVTILADGKFETDWDKDLFEIIRKRNNIAHQFSKEIVLPEDLENAFKIISDFSISLADVAKNWKIPMGLPKAQKLQKD